MRGVVFAWACLIVLASTLFSKDAHAYPWMIRHGYTTCATCHADPSGAGLLTAYGHAQSDLLLSTSYGSRGDADEPSRLSEALFGVVPLPDSVLLGGWVRNGYLWNTADGDLVDRRFLQMRADLGGQVTLGHFRANATIGFAAAETASFTQQAWVTSNADGPNLVSREHWGGVDLDDGAILLRAGRMNLPFGLRNIEHTSWIRSETRTDTNQQQSHGVAAAYSGESVRAEVMLVAGNYQINPDRYRERGLSAYAELGLGHHYALGVSSLAAHAAADLASRRESVRQAHGVFARAAPWKPLVLMAEADLLLRTQEGSGTALGVVGFVQGDFELLQGVHGLLTFEALHRAEESAESGLGGWASMAWFFLPHFDVRGDVIRRTGLGAPTTMTYLVQLHGYL